MSLRCSPAVPYECAWDGAEDERKERQRVERRTIMRGVRQGIKGRRATKGGGEQDR